MSSKRFNPDINLDDLLKQIKDYEYDIIKRINHFVNIYDKEDYLWRCVDLLRSEEFIEIDAIWFYLSDIKTIDCPSLFMDNVIQVIYGTDNFSINPINGRYYGLQKKFNKEKIEQLFDKHGDNIIKLTHYICFEIYWWDNIMCQFKNNLIKCEILKRDVENFEKNFGSHFPNKCLSDASFIKTRPNDYYEVKINGYGINDIDYTNLGYKNKYGFTVDFGYDDFTFTHQTMA